MPPSGEDEAMSHVLIVDDDEKIREVLRRFLEGAGHEVLEAESSEDAVQSVTSRSPAVAFCDMHMAGANGLWLTDQIRTLSPTTAMVLATGDTKIPPAESFRSGIVAYLIKPFNRQAVLKAVDDGMRWSAEAAAKAAGRRTRGHLGPGEPPD
jgi:DNA-binding NtrC family response regulator